MKIEKGFFKDWEITSFRAEYDGYALWTANGFLLFTDVGGAKELLSLCNYWERKKLWRELKREKRERLKKIFN